MPYAFVQGLGNENNAAGVTTVATGNLASQVAGNTNIVVVYYESAGSQTITLSDTQGNTYTVRGTELVNSPSRLVLFDDLVINAGVNSITATFGVAVDFPAIYCAEYSGLSAFDVQSKNAQPSPGTGTDAVVSGAASNTVQPALHFGFSFQTGTSFLPAAGTSFTARAAASWDYGGVASARPEDRRLTSIASQQATFTAGADTLHMTLMGVYREVIGELLGPISKLRDQPMLRGPGRRRIQRKVLAYTSVGGILNLLSIDGTLSFVGTLIKQTNKPLSGTLSFIGLLIKETTKILTGTLSFVGVLIKQTNKTLSGVLSFSGLLTTVRVFLRDLAGTLNLGGDLTKQINKIVAGTLSFVGTLVKQTNKVLSGTLNSVGTLIRRTSKFFSGTLNFSSLLEGLRIPFIPGAAVRGKMRRLFNFFAGRR